MLKIGIVGLHFGSYGLLPAFRKDNRCSVIAIAGSSLMSSRAAAEKFGIPEGLMWPNLVDTADVVAIAVPPLVQEIIIDYASSLGKPVFAEKPLASSLVQAEHLASKMKARNIPGVVDFIFPQLIVWQNAKSLLDSGYIGIPMSVNAEWSLHSYDHKNSISTWKTETGSGGGVLAHFGSHCLYYLEWLLGQVESIAAVTYRPDGYKNTGETSVSLQIVFESGVIGTLLVSSNCPSVACHRVSIMGTDGKIVIENKSDSPVHGFKLAASNRQSSCMLEEPEVIGIDCRVAPVHRLATKFIDWVLGGQPARPDFQDGSRVQKLIDVAIGIANKDYRGRTK